MRTVAGDDRADGDDGSGGGGERLADAGYGEDRRDRGEGVGGPDDDCLCAGDGVDRLGARRGLLGAAELEALDQSLAALADHELLEGVPALAGANPGAHGVIAHRQNARGQADRVG